MNKLNLFTRSCRVGAPRIYLRAHFVTPAQCIWMPTLVVILSANDADHSLAIKSIHLTSQRYEEFSSLRRFGPAVSATQSAATLCIPFLRSACICRVREIHFSSCSHSRQYTYHSLICCSCLCSWYTSASHSWITSERIRNSGAHPS